MNENHRRILQERKSEIQERLDPNYQPFTYSPVISGANTQYDISSRMKAVICGGLGAIHRMVQAIGLASAINTRLHLFKMTRPYFESDHVLNLAYNILAGGRCIDDLELLRNDPSYLDMLGAQRIPDPTTAGDFCRRFEVSDIEDLQDGINDVRVQIWKRQRKIPKTRATLDVDGTIASTYGECKQGADFSYKGIYGYAPAVITLAETNEVIFCLNRSGSRPSHEGCVPYMDRAIELVRCGGFKTVRIRGDTDFSLTTHFDRWTEDRVEFVFGMDANRSFVAKAESLDEDCWTPLKRRPKRPPPKTGKRRRPGNWKDAIIKVREFKSLRLHHEHVTEIEYTPTKAKGKYRLIIVRKNISVEQGENWLCDEIRYFFYVTNVPKYILPARKVVQEANARCNQENVIEQLKNGVSAMRMPVNTLNANWAYMVMTCLAWNLKAWAGLLHPDVSTGRAILCMEFRAFLNDMMHVVCQVLKEARTVVLRILNTSRWAGAVMELHDHVRRLRWC